MDDLVESYRLACHKPAMTKQMGNLLGKTRHSQMGYWAILPCSASCPTILGSDEYIC